MLCVRGLLQGAARLGWAGFERAAAAGPVNHEDVVKDNNVFGAG